MLCRSINHARDGLRRRRRLGTRLHRAVVLCLAVVLAFVAAACEAHRPAAGSSPLPPLKVEVIAHLWWWEFRYPGTSIITADEMHIPAGRRIELELKTADDPDLEAVPSVQHEFYVPGLDVVQFASPGEVLELRFQSGAPAIYHGRCVEFCGLGHSKMQFIVFVDPPAKFAAWERNQQRVPVRRSGDGPVARGEEVFASSLCTTCHGVAGVSRGTLAPDLTHLASRTTIVGATLKNTPANLKKWIEDPEKMKAGAHMPPLGLRGRELDDLVAYLSSLK